MTVENFNHEIVIDEKAGKVLIYRLRSSGQRQLYTSTELPRKTWAEDPDEIRKFCQKLGENIILDSPDARRFFQI